MRILVPRLADARQINAQNLNAKALLSRFAGGEAQWCATHYGDAQHSVLVNPAVRLTRLWRGRLWPWHMCAFYQTPASAIFYPGMEWFDDLALRVRKISGRSIPIIATLEGFAGDEVRERELAGIFTHPIHCHRVEPDVLRRLDRVMNAATRIIAISPFLGRIAGALYGPKVCVLPLGYDDGLFHDREKPPATGRPRVICAAGVRRHKRPEVFLSLAQKFPQADFVWYGDGDMRMILLSEAASRGVRNFTLPGSITHEQLAHELRRSSILVLPSLSEGVPKITLEAAACGLAQIVSGHYETPSVVEGENGHVVWTDGELTSRLGQLLTNRQQSARMGAAGAELAKSWTWKRIAPLWEDCIIRAVRDRAVAPASKPAVQ